LEHEIAALHSKEAQWERERHQNRAAWVKAVLNAVVLAAVQHLGQFHGEPLKAPGNGSRSGLYRRARHIHLAGPE